MRVKVPRDLAGGSLLNAHRWIKSTIARENPGGSTADYKIQETNGTPISLSDLTSRNFDEVLVISGTRSNPARGALADRVAERGFIDANTANYPVSSPDWRYPSYNDNNRIGNNIAKLLPKDIDPSMLNRLAAQNGMFSALNTTTKLLYTDEGHFSDSATDPQIAALLQTYANAQQKLQHPILTNPARTFFGPDMNDGYRGVLSPDEAVKVWAADKFKLAESRLTTAQSSQLMDRARIIKMYDLDNPTNLKNFIDHVLTPYLVTSTANANLLKAMRHGDYHETTEETLGRFKGDYAETPQWKKLLAMLPMHAIDFYDGKDYALIAHPVFQRQSLAIQAMDDKLIKKIMKVVKDHPQNAKEAQSPGEIQRVGLMEWVLPERRLINRLLIAQQKILTTTDPSKHLELLRELYLGDSRDASIANSVRDMHIDKKVSYQRDVAGFRPTPPPYWPKPVVLSVMDALKENIHAFIEETDRFGAAFRQLASIPHMPPADARKQRITFTLGGEQASMSLDSLINLKNILVPLSSSVLMATGGAAGVDNPASGRLGAKTVVEAPGRPEMEFRSIGMSPRQKSPLFKVEDSVRHWKDVRFIIAAYSKNKNYFRDGLGLKDASEIYVLFEQMIHKHSRTEFNQLADETLNLLSIFMEVEETARHKYNYAMTENDRAFVLYLLNRLFDTIQVQPEWGDGSGDGGPGGRSDDEIVNILRHMQGPDQAVSNDQMNRRLQFNRRITAISNRLIADYEAGGMVPRPTEINNIFDELLSEVGLSAWGRNLVAHERARVLRKVEYDYAPNQAVERHRMYADIDAIGRDDRPGSFFRRMAGLGFVDEEKILP